MHKNQGFTLIELMVLVAVMGVLAAVAVPNFSATIKGNRDTAQIHALQNALAFARSEALKTGSATICAGASAACSSNDWSDGWVVVATLPSGAATVVRAFPATNGSSVTSSGGNQFAFNQSGMVFTNASFATATASTFSLCDSRGAAFGRSLDLLPTGRAMVGPKTGYTINGTTPLVCSSSN